MEENKKEVVLSVKNLAISFKTDRGIVKAVRGVSFDLYKGETLCIVGESGSGKSVTNKAIMGISANNAIIENGSIMYEGEDLIRVSEEEFHRIRGHKIGMIFQDPLSALNPVMRIGKQITEATLINNNILKKHYRELISKELVKYRNAKTNFVYDNENVDNEVTQIDAFFKQFKELSKHKDKQEELQNLLDAINKHENDIKVKVKNESDRLLERVGHFERKKERTIKENASDLKKNIAEVELKQTIGLKESNDAFVKTIEQVKDWQEFFAARKEFLSSYKKVIKANFKELYPLLKEDLKQRKREAKLENKAYADQLKQEHEAKVVEITNDLETAKKELEEYQASLSEEAKHKINEIKEHNALAQKKLNKMKKGNQDINISKTSRNEDLEILKTGDEKFDSLEARVTELEKNLDDEKQDYINKTKITRAEAKRMALEVMREVGIPMPEKRFKQYPFEFSGGMRQRIVIAIALTANPDILICDEPTTALDVTIQAQILELINRLKRERHLSCIFITHDLGVVANMADRVAVMYAGKIVEYGLANEVFFDPRHPYTWALLSSIPDVDSKEKLEAIPGTPPDMLNPPKGDAFALRSKYAMAIDFKYEPPFFKITDTHYAATWLLYPGAPKVEMPKIVKTRIENALREQKEKEERGANQNGKTY